MEKKTMGLEKYIRIYDNIISLESVSAIIRTFKDSEFIQAKIIKDDGTEIINEEDRKVGEYPLGTNKSHTETHWLRYLSYRISQAGADFTNKYKYVSQITFEFQIGMKVIIQGNLSLYVPRGQYQLQIVNMYPSGQGELWLAFEKLKNKFSNFKVAFWEKINW